VLLLLEVHDVHLGHLAAEHLDHQLDGLGLHLLDAVAGVQAGRATSRTPW
jgi:hypothetical protein